MRWVCVCVCVFFFFTASMLVRTLRRLEPHVCLGMPFSSCACLPNATVFCITLFQCFVFFIVFFFSFFFFSSLLLMIITFYLLFFSPPLLHAYPFPPPLFRPLASPSLPTHLCGWTSLCGRPSSGPRLLRPPKSPLQAGCAWRLSPKRQPNKPRVQRLKATAFFLLRLLQQHHQQHRNQHGN